MIYTDLLLYALEHLAFFALLYGAGWTIGAIIGSFRSVADPEAYR